MDVKNTTFWTKDKDQVLEILNSKKEGLDSSQANQRLEEFGPNSLSEEKKDSIAKVFLLQFKDLLVFILCIAAVISMLSGKSESTLVIFAVLILNAVLGTVQHVKAEKSLDSLRAMSTPSAKVFRNGSLVEVPSDQVVPGDILSLEAGDLIIADGRILENFSLKVDEAALTGESESVDKTYEVIPREEITVGDRKNMVFSGSLVTYGRAIVVVTGTGMDTQIGQIAALMNQTKQRKTPLQISLDNFSKKLAVGILLVCAIVFALSVFRTGMPVIDSLMFAVALAVAAIPEALSSIVTIVLAIGTQKMAKERAIIKELKAVESLGCVSVICSDKTGTLTQNKMTVQKFYINGREILRKDFDIKDEMQNLFLHIALLSSDATTDANTGEEIGDPTEIALIHVGDDLGIDEIQFRKDRPRLSELAFDSDRKLMSTLHMLDDTPCMLTKGAIDVILGRANRVFYDGKVSEMTDEIRADIEKANMEFSEKGLRVLGFGFKTFETCPTELTFEDESDYIFVGLVAMIDPPRPEAVAAVADAKRAGIKTVMITGDHKVTATAIATEIGIFQEGDKSLTGVELEAISDEELDKILPQVSVYARVSPEHKIRIVTAWQRRDAIAAMTGDGVNDAPALKKADIGVAMGITGTEVSKDAAAMILSDDNFATIVRAVANGRAVYANIKNVIGFLLSGNTAGVLAVIYAAIVGLAAPFEAVHLLFINLLTDSLPAIAIGMEPSRNNLLDEPPRNSKSSILDKTLIQALSLQGIIIAVATMTAYYIGLEASAATAATMAFATLSLARLFHGFNCRSNGAIWQIGFKNNPFSIYAFLIGAALLFAVLLIPGLHGLFLVTPLTGMQLGAIVGLAIVPTVLIQVTRTIRALAQK